MPRLIAYLCNNDSLTPVAARAVASTLDFPDTADASGFGFGWIQDGRSLLRTNPKPTPSTPPFVDLFGDIPSRAIIGHIHGVDEPVGSNYDLQPFRFRKWVVAHAGEQPSPETLEPIRESIPKFIRGNLKGTVAAEVFGHTFLAELHSDKLLDKGRTNRRGCAEAMARTIRRVQVEAAVASFNGVAVTDRGVVAGTIGRELYYRQLRGVDDVAEEPLFAGHDPRPKHHAAFKAVLVSDAVTEDQDAWEPIPDRHVLWVKRDWTLQFLPVDDVD